MTPYDTTTVPGAETEDDPATQWTAPNDGQYQFNITFENRTMDGQATGVFVIVDGTIVHNSTVSGYAGHNAASGSQLSNYSGSFTLAAGDTVYIGVNALQGQGLSHDGGAHQVGVTAYITGPGPVTCGGNGFEYVPADLNYDCKINFDDFLVLADTYLMCTDPSDPGCGSYQQIVAREEWLLADPWLKAAFTGVSPKPPISFVYNGVSSDTFLRTWGFTRTQTELDPNRTQWTLIYTEPSNGPLKVTCQATEYHDYPAVEWVVYLENIGSGNTPIIENIQALATNMYCSAIKQTTQWDAATDWGNAPTNPNGAWSYEQGWIGNMAPLNQYDTSTGLQRWSASGTIPYIAKNTSENPITADGASVVSGKLVMKGNNGYDGGSPGPGSCPGLTWTCPETGFYNINIALKNIGAGGNGVQWCLYAGANILGTGDGNIDDQGSGSFQLTNQLISQGEKYGVT
ncbi:MAG: hypothetical protein Q7T18_02825, partial [Sedimentisphaerales bacterium]|nr:hypothetical protein [Sedimentisphaerales bacterium]